MCTVHEKCLACDVVSVGACAAAGAWLSVCTHARMLLCSLHVLCTVAAVCSVMHARPPPLRAQSWLENHPKWGKTGDARQRVSLASLEKLIDRLEKESGKLGSTAEISQVR
jgi:hypothetical protein